MNSISKKIAILCVVLPMMGLVGCAATGVGGSDSALMADLLSERAVYRALYQDTGLSDDSILVGCVDGVITLSGTVDDDVERQLAERLAMDVPGVTAVNNNLTTRS